MKASHFIPLDTALAATLGLAISGLLSRWSQTLLSAIHESAKLKSPLVLFQLCCGVTTGTIAIERSFDKAATICIVAALLVIQLPLDVLTRRLSRAITAGAFVGMLTISFLRISFRDDGEDSLKSLLLSTVIVGLFAVLHVVSPNSLGFGDVLLVAPLTIAVTSSSMFAGVLWLIASCGSAAAHGVVTLIRRRERDLPFGPHLLGTAWALLVVGV